MSELKYLYNEENEKCILFLKETESFKEDDIHLVINIKDKSVNKIHDFIHKLMVKKIIDNDYRNFNINQDDISNLLTDDEFNKLNIFLKEQIEKVNATLNLLNNDEVEDDN